MRLLVSPHERYSNANYTHLLLAFQSIMRSFNRARAIIFASIFFYASFLIRRILFPLFLFLSTPSIFFKRHTMCREAYILSSLLARRYRLVAAATGNFRDCNLFDQDLIIC